MSEFQFRKDSDADEMNSIFIKNGKNSDADELDNIFIKSGKGCEWYSLTDDLTNDVHSLGISNLHSVTAQLLSSQALSSTDETSLSLDDPLNYSSLIPDLDVIQETCESSSLDEGDGDIEAEILTETTPEELLSSEHEYLNFNYRHKKPFTNSPSMRRLVLPTLASTSESNNSDSSIQSCSYGQVKRKGGWPKGRKRKPPDSLESKPPKAPSTGYVLYLIEQRRKYNNKDMSFPEVTKKIGNDWSKMNDFQKKYYLDKAEIDKKRYREELRQYRKSEAYQRKRLKHRPNGTEESDFDATDEIEDDDNDELYCKACDQWFVTYHNKKEHLHGKQHLGKISKWKQSSEWTSTTTSINDNSSSYSFDESSLDAVPSTSPRRNGSVTHLETTEPTPNMHDNIINVIKTFGERESEISFLRCKMSIAQERNEQLSKQISTLKVRKKQLSKLSTAMKEEEKRIQKSLSKFRNIISKVIMAKKNCLHIEHGDSIFIDVPVPTR